MNGKKKSHIEGVTIFEIMLVLVIMAGILYFSISQYLLFRRDADIRIVQSNVDMLYDSMVKYFYANCDDPTVDRVLYSYYPQQYYPLRLNTLINSQYLILPPNQLMPFSPIVNVKGKDQGYMLQFNQFVNKTPPPVLPQRTIQVSPDGTTVNAGSIILWQIQVAVELQDKTNAKLYKNLLGADCLSNASGNYVIPCEDAPANADQYAVWMRLPGLGSSEANSSYWQTKPLLRQFNQMYGTDPILSLTYETSLTQTQYYRCGWKGSQR